MSNWKILSNAMQEMKRLGYYQDPDDNKRFVAMMHSGEKQHVIIEQNEIGGLEYYRRLSDEEAKRLLQSEPLPTQATPDPIPTGLRARLITVVAQEDVMQGPYTFIGYELATGECCVYYPHPGCPEWYTDRKQIEAPGTGEILKIEESSDWFSWAIQSVRDAANATCEEYGMDAVPLTLQYLVNII